MTTTFHAQLGEKIAPMVEHSRQKREENWTDPQSPSPHGKIVHCHRSSVHSQVQPRSGIRRRRAKSLSILCATAFGQTTRGSSLGYGRRMDSSLLGAGHAVATVVSREPSRGDGHHTGVVG